MLGNYLKVAIRNLLRHKGFSLINIAGLTAGLAACITILLWVFFNLSFDSFHANADRICWLWPTIHITRKNAIIAVTKSA